MYISGGPNDITYDDVIAFLAERSNSAHCPFCSTDQWSVMEPAVGFHFPTGVFQNHFDAMQLIALVCNQCAFVRPLSRALIGEWKRRKSE